MGNFSEKVIRGVRWIGGCICKVVRWFFEVIETISKIVEDFLFSIEEIIKNADDPKTFGEAAGIKKEMICLEKEYEKRRETLTSSDRNKLDDLFKDPPNY